MSMYRLTLALVATLGLLGLAAAAERAPAPRDVSPDRALDELVRTIDRHLDEFWAREGITPAPIASDAEFLRRLSLDVVGRIPTAAEARAFIENTDPDKRTKKIDELLARPGHVNFFATVLRQTWVPQTQDNPQIQFAAPNFEAWLKARLRDNTPTDRLVRE